MKTIEQLITFETAKLAKEKGFNMPTRNFYANWDDGLIPDKTVFNCSIVGYPEFTNEGLEGFGDIILIPTQSLLQKWLREEHDIHLTVTSISQESWQCHITKIGDSLGKKYFEDFYTYEEALEKGLIEALKLIKWIN